MENRNMGNVLLCVCLLLPVPALAQLPPRPRIIQTGNAFGWLPAGAVHGGIARGALLGITGERLGPDVEVDAGSDPDSGLAGVSVKLTILDQSYALALVSARSDLVVALVPGDVPSGTATVIVAYTGGGSDPATVHIVDSTFGIATQLGTGYGPAFASNVVGNTATMNTLLNPAKPGQEQILYGTGLGVSGERPIVWVGNFSARILNAGPLGSSHPGIEQIQIVVPEGIEGCYVPVAVQVGMSVSNFVSIAISAADGACSDPLSYTHDELETIRNMDTVRLGAITVVDEELQFGMASFFEYTRDALLQSVAVFGMPPYGTCTVNSRTYDLPVVGLSMDSRGLRNPRGLGRPLDAGATLSLQNVPPGTPGTLPVRNWTLDRAGSGQYYAWLNPKPNSPAFFPGPLTLTGPGGENVGVFTADQTWKGASHGIATADWNNWVPGDPQDLHWSSYSQQGVYSELVWDLQGEQLVCSIKLQTSDAPGFLDQYFQLPGFVTLAIAQCDQDGTLHVPNVPGFRVSLIYASLPTRFSAPGLDLGVFFSRAYGH